MGHSGVCSRRPVFFQLQTLVRNTKRELVRCQVVSGTPS